MLSLSALEKRFGDVVALAGASFVVPPGRIVGFLGPNGAGKTTAMRCIFGLVKPDAGEIRWNGSPVTPEDRLRFGYMPEERGLYPKMAVGEQLSYFARLSGRSKGEATEDAAHWLGRLGLTERAASKLEELSHGNQQRVQLAAALVHGPELAVLDEPFAGLDPLGVETMAATLRGLAASGVGIVFSSHQLDLVQDVCEDVVIIHRGRVVLAGPLSALRESARHRHLTIAVGGAHWTPPAAVVDAIGGVAAGNHLLVDRGADLGAVVAAAGAAGRITRFSFEPPALSDLFREAVTG